MNLANPSAWASRARRLWTIAGTIHTQPGLKSSLRKLQFLVLAARHHAIVHELINSPVTSALGVIIRERPQTLGALIWPYQTDAWSPRERLVRIQQHYEVLSRLNPKLRFPLKSRINLAELGDLRPGLSVQADQPSWFIREGQLVINLFVNETRLYSVAFSFFVHAGKPAAFVGAIQGRDIEGVTDEYRLLTKCCHGLRPRDFLIEAFRIFCLEIGIESIFAVSDEHRHHRHSYFGGTDSFSSSYNNVWEERGGKRFDAISYQLESQPLMKPIEEVPSKKRSMYKRRYEMLTSMRKRIRESLKDL